MTKLQRIKTISAGFITIITALIMLGFPNESYEFIILFLSLGFMASGIGTLIYYFSMARYMVGGKMTLYKGVILFDFGVLTGSFAEVPKVYILLYLAAIHLFSGLVEVLRARETKLSGSSHYKLKLAHGIINIVMALCCIVFINKTNTAVIIYCLGLIYSGIMRIITGFRRTVFVYIQ